MPVSNAFEKSKTVMSICTFRSLYESKSWIELRMRIISSNIAGVLIESYVVRKGSEYGKLSFVLKVCNKRMLRKPVNSSQPDSYFFSWRQVPRPHSSNHLGSGRLWKIGRFLSI